MDNLRCAFTFTNIAHGKLQCPLPTEETYRWCPGHNDVSLFTSINFSRQPLTFSVPVRRKVYFGYKACHKALDALPEISISIPELRKCSSYETVKSLCVKLREKLKFLRRCIDGRMYFTERFFGNDEDLGHETFRLNLEQQSTETERLLEQVENRAYLLLLLSQNAAWVMEDSRAEAEDECDIFGEESILKPKKPVPFEEIEDEEDPVDVAIREKREEIWEKIWTRLARYCAPVKSRYYHERLDVIWSCISRAVIKDPKLMMVAQNYPKAKLMLSDTDLDLLTVEKLWKVIKDLRIDDVRAAIEDVFYPCRETGEYVVVFGTRVHKDLSSTGLLFRGWGHMTAIYPCYSCVRKACKTVDEIVVLTRFVHFTGVVLSQSFTRYHFDYAKFNGLAFCGFLPNFIKEQKPRFTTKKCNGSNQSFWSEMKTNNSLCVGLSLTDPMASAFVNACFRDSRLMVCCRKGANARVLRNRQLCGLEIRQASTQAGLKSVPWEPHALSYIQDEDLEHAKPIVSNEKRIEDCFQVIIVDGGEGDMNDFIEYLLNIWLKLHNAKDMGPLICSVAKPYQEEFDLAPTGGMTHYIELDAVEAYKELWGRDPREKGVDDELINKVAYYSPY